MQVVLEIHENYSNILSVTVVGNRKSTVNVSTAAMDLNKNTYARIDENGFLHFTPEVKEG